MLSIVTRWLQLFTTNATRRDNYGYCTLYLIIWVLLFIIIKRFTHAYYPLSPLVNKLVSGVNRTDLLSIKQTLVTYSISLTSEWFTKQHSKCLSLTAEVVYLKNCRSDPEMAWIVSYLCISSCYYVSWKYIFSFVTLLSSVMSGQLNLTRHIVWVLITRDIFTVFFNDLFLWDASAQYEISTFSWQLLQLLQ